MATEERFTELIGNIIKTCGLLEWQFNHFIRTSSKDPILAKHVRKLPLSRRIEVLQELMLDRLGLTLSEVKSLCKDLKKVAEDRNVIAHNPVVVSTKPHPPKIVDFAHGKRKEFKPADLEVLHKRTSKTLGCLMGLMPQNCKLLIDSAPVGPPAIDTTN